MWSRDGRELFYQSGRAIMVVSVEVTGQSFQWGTARVLFEGTFSGFGGTTGPRNYDLSPDGKRFLMIKDAVVAESAGPQIIVVQNWFEELKRKIPSSGK